MYQVAAKRRMRLGQELWMDLCHTRCMSNKSPEHKRIVRQPAKAIGVWDNEGGAQPSGHRSREPKRPQGPARRGPFKKREQAA